MGLLSFVKGAGKKIFGDGDAKEVAAQAAADAQAREMHAMLRRKRMEKALHEQVTALGIAAEDLQITCSADDTVTVSGRVADQATREKLLLALGNVDGIAAVQDSIEVEHSEPESAFYTVVRGDTLSKIAKQHYGNANKYMVIFEANKPMLSDPDKIYPGQVLRIPPLPEKS